MNESPVSGYVTILTANWLIPIGELWNSLVSKDPVRPSDVQTSPPENGLSIGLVIMTVLFLESALHRTYYIMKSREELSNSKEEFRSIEFFKAHFDEGLSKILEELITVRDVVAHNHIWECKTQDDLSGLKLVSEFVKFSGGNKRFSRVVDEETLKTRKLGINIIPTRIWRGDARKVLVESYKILEYLENIDRDYIYLSHYPVRFGDSALELREFVETLQDDVYPSDS